MITFSDSDPPWEQVLISEEDCHAVYVGDGGAGNDGAGDDGVGDDGAIKTMEATTMMILK